LDLSGLWHIVLALVIGGAVAAPFAGWFLRVLPPRVAMIMVAGVVLCKRCSQATARSCAALA
jgi:hypothetical protein